MTSQPLTVDHHSHFSLEDTGRIILHAIFNVIGKTVEFGDIYAKLLTQNKSCVFWSKKQWGDLKIDPGLCKTSKKELDIFGRGFKDLLGGICVGIWSMLIRTQGFFCYYEVKEVDSRGVVK